MVPYCLSELKIIDVVIYFSVTNKYYSTEGKIPWRLKLTYSIFHVLIQLSVFFFCGEEFAKLLNFLGKKKKLFPFTKYSKVMGSYWNAIKWSFFDCLRCQFANNSIFVSTVLWSCCNGNYLNACNNLSQQAYSLWFKTYVLLKMTATSQRICKYKRHSTKENLARLYYQL